MQGPDQTNMPCPRCGHDNDTTQSFCGQCGLQIDGVCPNCMTRNAHSAQMCGTCGFDFVRGELPAAASPMTHDLRHQPTGAPIEPHGFSCPRCHHSNDATAAFCYNCGLPFDEEARRAGGAPVAGIPAFTQGRPGGFWIRVVAFFIDGIVVAPLILLVATTFTDVTIEEFVRYYVEDTGPLFDWRYERFNLVEVVYHTILVAFWSTTVGKRALGMRVLRTDGRRVGFLQAFGRELAKIVSTMILFVGFIIAAFREDKRTLHDLIAGTVVVKQ